MHFFLFQEAWYRFQGEAGTHLADYRDPPEWEDCGTSRVAWLKDPHPFLKEGTVNRYLKN